MHPSPSVLARCFGTRTTTLIHPYLGYQQQLLEMVSKLLVTACLVVLGARTTQATSAAGSARALLESPVLEGGAPAGEGEVRS